MCIAPFRVEDNKASKIRLVTRTGTAYLLVGYVCSDLQYRDCAVHYCIATSTKQRIGARSERKQAAVKRLPALPATASASALAYDPMLVPGRAVWGSDSAASCRTSSFHVLSCCAEHKARSPSSTDTNASIVQRLAMCLDRRQYHL
jgi:hypothetical protein